MTTRKVYRIEHRTDLSKAGHGVRRGVFQYIFTAGKQLAHVEAAYQHACSRPDPAHDDGFYFEDFHGWGWNPARDGICCFATMKQLWRWFTKPTFVTLIREHDLVIAEYVVDFDAVMVGEWQALMHPYAIVSRRVRDLPTSVKDAMVDS